MNLICFHVIACTGQHMLLEAGILAFTQEGTKLTHLKYIKNFSGFVSCVSPKVCNCACTEIGKSSCESNVDKKLYVIRANYHYAPLMTD